VGYAGKVGEQRRARALRAQGFTVPEIAQTLGVAKSSVSLWVRDVPIEPRQRRPSHRSGASHPLHLAKLAEIEECDRRGRERLGTLSEEAFLAAGAALHAGEGAKRDGKVTFANTDPGMMRFFCAWLRRFFEIDEARLRVRVYLHEGLDLDAAQAYWSEVTAIPVAQFNKPYRAVVDPSVRLTKHTFGCAYVDYASARTHREIMGLVRALLAWGAIPG
jgi:hypothetical protein